jgi:MFS family permease
MSSSSQHAITWLVQERGIPYTRAALLAGAMVALGGLVGTVVIGSLADVWVRAGLPSGRPGGLAALGLVAVASSAVFYLVPASSAAFLPSWFVSQAFMLGWFGPVTAEIIELAPRHLRATMAGFGLMVINILGVATGPWITGLIGDHVSLTRGLLISLVVGGAGLVVLAWAGVHPSAEIPRGEARPSSGIEQG